MNLDTWRTAALASAAVGQLVFTSLYLTFPWWKTFLGRALFGKAAMLTVIIVFIVCSRIFDFGRNDGLFVGFYTLLAVGIWAEVIAFVRVKRTGRESL